MLLSTLKQFGIIVGCWKIIDQLDMKPKGLGNCLLSEAWGLSWSHQEYCKQQIPKGINAFVNQELLLMCMPIQTAPCSALSKSKAL